MNKEKNLETCLVISTGMILLWFIYGNALFLQIAFALGIIGLFVNPIANWVTWIWYKIADVLGMIVPKILLSLIFFVFLFPVAAIYRLFNSDNLQLKKKETGSSYWIQRDHHYVGKDLEQIW